MKIAIIQKMPHEFFGVMHVSSAIKKAGHSCETFIADWEGRRLLENIRRSAPDILAFTLPSSDYRWFKLLVPEIRRYGLAMPIMVGGPHATFFPELIEENDVSFVFRGEAEESVEEFLSSYGDRDKVRSLKGIWSKGEDGSVFRNELRPPPQDLDALPFPDRAVYYDKYPILKRSSAKVFFTSRGCPYRCSYCHNAAMMDLYRGKGKYVRRFSRERVIREIQEVRARYGVKFVTFVDDLFCHNPEWVTEFLKTYKREIRLPFKCYVCADMVTEELIRALKDAGIHSLAFGVESGDERIRTEVLNKKVSDDDIVRCAGLLHKWGIPFTTFSMFAIPTETVNDALKTVEFNIRIKADFPWASLFIPYPMTGLTRLAADRGLLPPDFDFGNLPSSYFHSAPLRLPQKHILENIQKVFYFATRYPRMFPFFKKLVRLDFPAFFDLIFYLSSILRYSKERRLSLWETARVYWRVRKSY